MSFRSGREHKGSNLIRLGTSHCGTRGICSVLRKKFLANEPRMPRQPRPRKGCVGYFRALEVEKLEDRSLLSITAELLADINAQPLGIMPAGPGIVIDNTYYFCGA